MGGLECDHSSAAPNPRAVVTDFPLILRFRMRGARTILRALHLGGGFRDAGGDVALCAGRLRSPKGVRAPLIHIAERLNMVDSNMGMLGAAPSLSELRDG